jgi:hypothetical protein
MEERAGERRPFTQISAFSLSQRKGPGRRGALKLTENNSSAQQAKIITCDYAGSVYGHGQPGNVSGGNYEG